MATTTKNTEWTWMDKVDLGWRVFYTAALVGACAFVYLDRKGSPLVCSPEDLRLRELTRQATQLAHERMAAMMEDTDFIHLVDRLRYWERKALPEGMIQTIVQELSGAATQ